MHLPQKHFCYVNKDKLPTNFFSKTTNKISKTTISGQDHSKLGHAMGYMNPEKIKECWV